MSEQPEALRLADAIDGCSVTESCAAAELRRLHELHVLYQDKVERLEKLCYDYLGELTALRAAKQMQARIDELKKDARQRDLFKENPMLTDKQLEEHLARVAGAETVTLPADTWQAVLEELEQRRRGDFIRIGNYFCKPFKGGENYWIGNTETGEGMQIGQPKLYRYFNDLWNKEF